MAAVALGLVAAGGLLVRWRRPPAPLPHEVISSRPAVVWQTDSATLDDLRRATKDASMVICVLDAARADHIGCYGYPRSTTPNIDALAAGALTFERHYAEFPETQPSSASLLTGQHADTHLCMQGRRLDENAFTIATGLAAAGFETGFFSSNGWCSPAWGHSDGFATVYSVIPGAGGDRPLDGGRSPSEVHAISHDPEALLAAFAAWLGKLQDERFFAYVHFLPPHFPYDAPPAMAQAFTDRPPAYRRGPLPFRGLSETKGPVEQSRPSSDLVNHYDANLRYADWAVGELMGQLRARGLLKKTLFILTSDHGEAFGEHGYTWHPACPFEETLHVPLLLRFGDHGPVGRVFALTQSIDVLPTIYDLLQLPLPPRVAQGSSLLPLLTGQDESIHDFLFSRTAGQTPCYVVHDLDHALLLYKGGKQRALYDIDADPEQHHNGIAQEPERAAQMTRAFESFIPTQRGCSLQFLAPDAKEPAAPADESGMPRELRNELRTLGYLQ